MSWMPFISPCPLPCGPRRIPNSHKHARRGMHSTVEIQQTNAATPPEPAPPNDKSTTAPARKTVYSPGIAKAMPAPNPAPNPALYRPTQEGPATATPCCCCPYCISRLRKTSQPYFLVRSTLFAPDRPSGFFAFSSLASFLTPSTLFSFKLPLLPTPLTFPRLMPPSATTFFCLTAAAAAALACELLVPLVLSLTPVLAVSSDERVVIRESVRVDAAEMGRVSFFALVSCPLIGDWGWGWRCGGDDFVGDKTGRGDEEAIEGGRFVLEDDGPRAAGGSGAAAPVAGF